MRVNHFFTRRPREDRETTVLRCYQGKGIALIVYELRRREVAGPAVMGRMDDRGFVADDRFRDDHLLHRCGPLRASDLRPERQQLILVVDYSCAVNRGEAGNRVDCLAYGCLPRVLVLLVYVLSHQICETGKVRHY